jgi:hypothetical protein
MRFLPLLVAGMLSGACATAPPLVVLNPTQVSFRYADWATAARFDGAYFEVPLDANGNCLPHGIPTGTPTFLRDLGNPLTGATGSTLLPARPLGCYAYRVRGIDQSGLPSPWGLPSNIFINR